MMKRIFFSFVLIASIFFAQEKKMNFNVESFVINDSLTAKAPVEKNLGRYNNFEIHLNKADEIAISLKAEGFLPLALFVSPGGRKFVFNSEDGKQVNFVKEIEESGNWNLFIIGGENESGKYVCRVSFADSSAVLPQQKLRTCDFLRFFVAHSKAEFAFLKENLRKKIALPELVNGKVLSKKFNEKNRFEIKVELQNKNDFENLTNAVVDCFEEWNVKEGRARRTENGFVKTLSAIESGVKEPSYVKMIFENKNDKKTASIEVGLLK